MPRSLYAVVLAVFALVVAPVIATLITVSGSSDVEFMRSAVWAWGGAGVLALVGMVVFGVVVLRRSARAVPVDEAAVTVPVSAEVAEPVFA